LTGSGQRGKIPALLRNEKGLRLGILDLSGRTVVSLLLSIVLSAAALFFASFLSWMVLRLHAKDWVKLDKEADFMRAAAQCNIPVGSYMFPCPGSPAEMQTEEFKKRHEEGPRGVLTIFPKVSMGQNLIWTALYFLAVSIGLAYLTTIAFKPGADFLSVFRFVFTAAFMTFLAAMVSHAIWFRPRIVGHIIESVAYAVITAVLFAALWPAT
jgi:hypothetical protein